MICVDIQSNVEDALGCSTYQILNQTDSTQYWQQAYYAIQNGDSTRYVINWLLERQ